jgi:hypothetical protein
MVNSNNDLIELRNIDSEDIDDVLRKLEKSFKFKFGESDLAEVKSFGDLCDIITLKIKGVDTDDCTTQQAFYRLRTAIKSVLAIEKGNLTPALRLEALFPRKNRRQKIADLEYQLGFKLTLLTAKSWVMLSLVLLLLISLITFFIYWQAAIAGLCLSIAGFILIEKFAKEFILTNLGEVAQKISRENYCDVRTKHGTVNRVEIVKKTKEIFEKDLDLNQSALTKGATFF